MLLSGIPSPADAAEGRPIGGKAWELAVRMLAAIGFTPEQAYVAALTCFSSAGARMSDGEVEACRDGLLHQIRLAAPKRLLLLGDAPAKLLLGTGLLAGRGKVHRIAGIPTVVTFPPAHLLQRGADKALAWRDLLLLMGEPL
jgi:DNA polymerase